MNFKCNHSKSSSGECSLKVSSWHLLCTIFLIWHKNQIKDHVISRLLIMADNKDNVAKEQHVVEDEKVVENTNNAKDEKKNDEDIGNRIELKHWHDFYWIRVH